MRATMLALALVMIAAGIAAADSAAPAIRVDHDDDVVVVRVSGVTVGGPATAGIGFFDIPALTGAAESRYLRIERLRVRKVEVGDGRIRIKLRDSGRDATRALVAATTIVADGTGLVITVPRRPGAPPPVDVVAEPPAAAAVVAPTATPLTATLPAVEAADALAVPAPSLAPGDAVAIPAAITGGRSSGIPWASLLMMVGVLSASALLYRQRKTRRTGPAPTLEIRTTMAMGRNARLVLIGAHDRELLVAVDSRGVRLLDSWSRDGDRDDDVPLAKASVHRQSASVSGLVRLRQGTTEVPRDEAERDGEEPLDDAWASDLIASLRSKGTPS